MSALYIRANEGTGQVIDRPTTHTAMARQIGSRYIERVRTPLPGVVMVVDEEGALREDRGLNIAVTGRLYPGRIFGSVLIVGEAMTPDGGLGFVDLTDEQVRQVCKYLGISPVHAPQEAGR